MSTHDLSPTPTPSDPKRHDSHSVTNDFDCPSTEDVDAPEIWPKQEVAPPRPSALHNWVWGASLAASALVALWWFQQGNPEQRHENWQHVVAASEDSTDFAQQLRHVDAQGNTQTLRSITLSEADRKQNATKQLRSALWRNDLVTATATLQAMQGLQELVQNATVRLPELLPDLAATAALRDGKAELFEIELFDCCDEDGDVVEILVNGTTFATVPITNGGTVLAIPLQRGQNSITVLAIRDGGGGVTVSLRTSHGHYFARYMEEGESHQMGVVVQ